MKDMIVATIHPFVVEQEISIYKDGENIRNLKCTLEDMGEKIYMSCEQYGIEKVEFYSGQLYALKFKEQFMAHKYGKRDIEIIVH